MRHDLVAWLHEGLDLLEQSVLIGDSEGRVVFANRTARVRAGMVDFQGMTLIEVAERLAKHGPREVGIPTDAFDALSPREREVLHAFLEGFGTQTIAQRLSLSPSTVRNHLKSVQKKLGVRSQIELRELFARTATAP